MGRVTAIVNEAAKDIPQPESWSRIEDQIKRMRERRAANIPRPISIPRPAIPRATHGVAKLILDGKYRQKSLNNHQ